MDIRLFTVAFVVLGSLCAAVAEHGKVRTLYMSLPDAVERFGIFITLVLLSTGGGAVGIVGGVIAGVLSTPTLELFTANPATQHGLRAAILFSYTGLVSYVVTGVTIASLFQKWCASSRR